MAGTDRHEPQRAPRAIAGTAGWPTSAVPWPAVDFGFARPWLARCLEREVEQRRLFNALPVAFGIGILLFFAAEGRPALWAPLASCALCTGAALVLRSGVWSRAAAIGAAFVFAGFAAGVIRARSVEAPILARITIGPLTGFIEAIEERPAGGRITLRTHAFANLAPEALPRRVRITVRDPAGLRPGDFIAANARLLPPPAPAWPGGYDFARDAYFRGIGAVGSLTGRALARPPPVAAPWDLSLAASVDDARNILARRIANAIGGPAGAVAAALVTGKRGFIAEETNDILRAAGIYHIVSISGLHMVLAAGTFFWLARALLALSTRAALRWPVKKVAALVAMLGASAYCIFSGSEVATERSLVMTLVMFGAILADRPALSMRNLAIAALIVLAREPESLIGPSFQMSFGAVAALIALAGAIRTKPPVDPVSGLDRAARWGAKAVLGLLGTTLVASLATAPFGAYHFQALNPLGLIGNALALPLVSLAVMPAALLGTLAYPFGLDRPVWLLMGQAVDGVLAVSGWVSGLTGASVMVPAFGAGALLLMACALLLATLPASGLRWLAVVPAGAGLALAASPDRYDLFVDREGAGAAIRGAEGRLVLVGRPSDFVAEQWLRADGDARRAKDPSVRAGARCDRLGCVVALADGRAVAFVQDARAFREDCGRAAALVSRLSAPQGCAAAIVLDRRFLQANGATALAAAGAGFEVRTSRPPGDPRPWMHAPPPAPILRPASPAMRPSREDGPEPEPGDLSIDGRG